MEVISVLPDDVKREIISSIPELIDDSQHADAAERLKLVSVVSVVLYI